MMIQKATLDDYLVHDSVIGANFLDIPSIIEDSRIPEFFPDYLLDVYTAVNSVKIVARDVLAGQK